MRWLAWLSARWRARIESAPPWDASRSLTAPARPATAKPAVWTPPLGADDDYYREELLALSAERWALYQHHRHRTHGVREQDAAIDRILDAWWQSRQQSRR